MIRSKVYTLFMLLCYALWLGVSAEQCGRQADGALCPDGQCCSEYGWCGTTEPYCTYGCQSQCPGESTPPPPRPTPTPAGGGVSEIVSEDLFNEMLKHRDDLLCPGRGFYTYDAFIIASQSFIDFGTTGDEATRKREVAAFFGQTSHETTGGWSFALDGPYAWGYCFINDFNTYDSYCVPSRQYPCARGRKYYGRGPFQLSYNYNYGMASDALGLDLLTDPDLVATDPTVSFQTALWFWMTPQGNKPSSHDVMVGNWNASVADLDAGRVPGYGLVTNIINGGLECGRGFDDRVKDRIGFYKRYCKILGIEDEEDLDCYNQRPFSLGMKSLSQTQ